MKVAREALGLSRPAFTTKSGGITVRTLENNEGGANEAGAGLIAAFVLLGINANWLLTGEGPMFLDPGHELGRLITRMRGEYPVGQIAEWLELPPARVAGYESGAHYPDEGYLRDLARICNEDAAPLLRQLRLAEMARNEAYEPSARPSVRRDSDGSGVDSLLHEAVTRFFFRWLDANADRVTVSRERYAALIAVLYKMAAIRGSIHEPELDQMLRALA